MRTHRHQRHPGGPGPRFSGFRAGEPRTEMYLRLDGTTPTFSSDLPVMVLHNYGGSTPPAEGLQPAYLHVYEPVNGVTSMTNPPTFKRPRGIGAWGSSTPGIPRSASTSSW